MASTAQPAPRLLDQLRTSIRYRHYNLRTEKAYVYWVRAYVHYHRLKHPRKMGAAEVTAFLNRLSGARGCAPATHNQALSAILFLYREVLQVEQPWLTELQRPKQRDYVPVVLSRSEVERLLAAIEGGEGLIARLLYGTGMRLMEGLRLRVKDLDFDRTEITVRQGKGSKDRRVMLPDSLTAPLKTQLQRAHSIWEQDRHDNAPGVLKPDALARKQHRLVPERQFG